MRPVVYDMLGLRSGQPKCPDCGGTGRIAPDVWCPMIHRADGSTTSARDAANRLRAERYVADDEEG